MGLIPALFIALVLSIVSVFKRRQRKLKASNQLQDVATQLGMTRLGNELVGRRGDLPIGARLAFDSPHGEATAPQWTLYARLQPPLDLGLLVRALSSRVDFPGSGHNSFRTGDPHFDPRFACACDEPARGHALLNHAVRRSMTELLHARAMVMVTDGGVAVQTTRSADLTELRKGLDAVATIAHAINSARDNALPASPLAKHIPAWRSFAADQGLGTLAAPLCLFGTIESATVYAYAVRVDGGYELEVWMRFTEPLGLGLLLQPMRTLDRMKDLFAGADHKLGDPLFDETFFVQVSDPEGTELLFDDETRRRLLVIHDTVGPLSLTDEGLSIRLPMVPPDPGEVPRLVRGIVEIADYVSSKRQTERRGSPYR